MTVQTRYESPDSILQRIDQMIDELRVLRQAIQLLVSKESASQEDTSAIGNATSASFIRRSAVDILAEAPGHRLFQTSSAVDAYVSEERSSWGN